MRQSRYIASYVFFATMVVMVTFFQNCGTGFQPPGTTEAPASVSK